MLPKDPYILLSYINMKLRDENVTLESLIKREMADYETVIKALASIGYAYNSEKNTFIKI